nr:hypothetical protein [Micromonospora sp. DSM 115978]
LLTEYVEVCGRVDQAARAFGQRLTDLLPWEGGLFASLLTSPADGYASALAKMLVSVALVTEAGLGYAPGGRGGPRFVIGPPTRPWFDFDDDFPYDPDADPGWADYASWAKWKAMLKAGEVARPDLDDATALYQHYTSGSGDPRVVDYEEGYREDERIRTAVDAEIASAQTWAEQLAAQSGLTEFSMTGDPATARSYVGGYPVVEENWAKTLGEYDMWS